MLLFPSSTSDANIIIDDSGAGWALLQTSRLKLLLIWLELQPEVATLISSTQY